MTQSEFEGLVKAQLDFTPNTQQSLVLGALTRFCSPAQRVGQVSSDRVFVLNGYAGTGKTSITGALVRALAQVEIPTLLLAPTGRAAKVFSRLAGMPAHTIHRKIYRHSLNGERPGLRENTMTGGIVIVDEASMIAAGYGNDDLLTDLVQYTFSGTDCSMILLGDTAQLPPVGTDFSPAMDYDTLTSLGLRVSRATLTAVARQDAMSGILANATRMRRSMKLDPMPQPQILTEGYGDVHIADTYSLPEDIYTCFGRDGVDETVLITRSNRRAADFNRAIRSEVLYYEDELVQGDLLLVAKNNYHWSRGVKGLDFIANGDTLVVNRIHGTDVRYGMRFADVSLSLPDNPEIVFDAKVMLDTLASDDPALSTPGLRALYDAIMAEAGLYGADVAPNVRTDILRKNPYWNAMQVKYAYAVTCHKAQGGQWRNVFVDLTYIAPESIGLEFYRWLYTATTRARQNLYIISNPED